MKRLAAAFVAGAMVIHFAGGASGLRFLMNLEAYFYVLAATLLVLWISFPWDELRRAAACAVNPTREMDAGTVECNRKIFARAADAALSTGGIATLLGLIRLLAESNSLEFAAIPARTSLALNGLFFGLFLSWIVVPGIEGRISQRRAVIDADGTRSRHFAGWLQRNGLPILAVGVWLLVWSLLKLGLEAILGAIHYERWVANLGYEGTLFGVEEWLWLLQFLGGVSLPWILEAMRRRILGWNAAAGAAAAIAGGPAAVGCLALAVLRPDARELAASWFLSSACGAAAASLCTARATDARDAARKVAPATQEYWAFISYSHLDQEWCDWLHSSIEGFRVPARLAGRPSRDGTVPERIFPVFRDRDELPTAGDLGGVIRDALRRSRYLVVICSPYAALSRWVNEEIRTFKALGKEDRVLCLITGGEPNVSDKPDCGLPECFPEALRRELGNDGRPTSERAEPIAADARPGKDGRDNALLKILAGLVAVGFDELRQRDLTRRSRQRAFLAAGVIVIAASVYKVWREHGRGKASEESRFYLEEAIHAAGGGDLESAALLSADAYRLSGSRWARANALSFANAYAIPRRIVPEWRLVPSSAFSPDGTLLVESSSGQVGLWHIRGDAGEKLHVLSDAASVRAVAFSPDGKTLLAAGDETLRLWDARSGLPVGGALHFRGKLVGVGFNQKGLGVLADSDGEFLRFWHARAGTALGTTLVGRHDAIQISPDFNRMAIARGGRIRLWDAGTGRPEGNELPGGRRTIFSPDGRTLAVATDDRVVRIWDSRTGEQVGKTLHVGKDIVALAYGFDGDSLLIGYRACCPNRLTT